MPTTLATLAPLRATSSFWWRMGTCIALCLLMAACGFRLKGTSPLPFTSIYTNIAENSAFGAEMRRGIVASSPHTHFVSDPAQSQVRLLQLDNTQSLHELSIDAHGQVEEYELQLDFIFQLTDAAGHLLLPPTTLTVTREVPYDSNAVQAKQGEIGNVFKEMQQSLVSRVIRHLSAPDVARAFDNADTLPIDERAGSMAPLPDTPSPPSPWGTPPVVPGSGF